MKNSKFQIFASIFQIVVGALAVVAFITLSSSGENMIRWIITLVLSISFIALGITNLFIWKK